MRSYAHFGGAELWQMMRLNYSIEPMDLASMRAKGVRSLSIRCHQCQHEAIMNVDHLPGDLTVPSFGLHTVCTKCRIIGADARPNWQEQPRAREPDSRATQLNSWGARANASSTRGG